jgi:F-type H+-transporting ATPase subunit epsilon
MARETFPVEVLTPEGEVFNDEVEMLSTRTTEGSIGILANHAPLMAMLDPTELRLYKSESDIVKFAQGEGYVQVTGNSALVLVEEAIPPDELDRANLEEKLKEAQARLERAEAPERDEGTAPRSLAAPEHRQATEERRRAENDVKRYEAFLELASGEGQ